MSELTKVFKNLKLREPSSRQEIANSVSKVFDEIPLKEVDMRLFLREASLQFDTKLDEGTINAFLFELLFFSPLSEETGFQDEELEFTFEYDDTSWTITLTLPGKNERFIALIGEINGDIFISRSWKRRYMNNLELLEQGHYSEERTITTTYGDLLGNYKTSSHYLSEKTLEIIQNIKADQRLEEFGNELPDLLKFNEIIVEGSSTYEHSLYREKYDQIMITVPFQVYRKCLESFSFSKVDINTGLLKMATPKEVTGIFSAKDLCELIDSAAVVFETKALF